MKKLTTISLFIFWAITTAVLIAGLVFYQNRTNLSGQNSIAQPDNIVASLPGAKKSISLTLSLAEIYKHNKINDCWLIINGKVYSMASYLSAHPGGAGTIIPLCGQDATTAFATKGGQGAHSSYAYSLLINYYIGDLNQNVSNTLLQQNINNTNTVVPPVNGRGRGSNEGNDD
jgi:cytochrome b involved in lipid metabolism